MILIRTLWMSLLLLLMQSCSRPDPEKLVQELTPGDSEARIVEIMGEPDLVEKSENATIWVYYSPNIGQPERGNAGISIIIQDGIFQQSSPVYQE